MEFLDNPLTIEAKEQFGYAFINKLKSIAKELKTNPIWLLAIMKHESNFKTWIKNSIGCVGLIQFCPGTAQNLGYSPNTIQQMTALEQLDLVKRYYEGSKYPLDSLYKLALFTYLPIAVPKPNDWVFDEEYIIKNPTLHQFGNTIKDYKKYVCEKIAKPNGLFCDDIPLIGGSEKKKSTL